MTEEERKEKRREIVRRSATKIYKPAKVVFRKDTPIYPALEHMRENTGKPMAVYILGATSEKLKKEGWL